MAARKPDQHGNRIRREGADRCVCGCKFWENDRCIDCGGTEAQPEETFQDYMAARPYLRHNLKLGRKS